jgi:hypothetical protein
MPDAPLLQMRITVEESWGALEDYRRRPDNVNLVLLNRQGFELVVIPDYSSGAAVGRSATVSRCFHLATVFWLIP